MVKKTITIFGTGRAREGDSAYSLAYEVGRVLAEAGFVIANGGYGGTMVAAALPARLLRQRPMNILLVKLLPSHLKNGSIH
jgi:predicted Rossmann-fold nucleotide-binding protein